MSNIFEYIARDLQIKPVNDIEKMAEMVFPDSRPKEQFFKRAVLMALMVAVRDNGDFVEKTTELLYDALDPIDETEFSIVSSILSVYPHFYHDDIPDMNVFDEDMIPF